MKILLVNTYDRGGAAIACLRLHSGLLQEGIDSQLLLRNKLDNPQASNIVELKKINKTIIQKVTQRFNKELVKLKIIKDRELNKQEFINNIRAKELEMFSFPKTNIDITESEFYKVADVINLHWVADFLDFPSFFKKNMKPIVWTLHDMNPFSGGEHYNEEFLGIDEFGYPVKRKLTQKEIKVAKKNIKIKKSALKKSAKLIIVTPSEWLASEARKSDLFKDFPVKCIPNGIDSKIFKPRDKNLSRELFNIPKDKKVILFVAHTISNNRKGFMFLKRAIEILNYYDIALCTVGHRELHIETSEELIELGFINNDKLMSHVFSAADVFIIPSLIDNLPNTVIESILCGTPVIGFPVGGIPEIIQNGKNGLITKEISVKSLKESIIKFLENSEKFDRYIIRKNAVTKYDKKVQSNNYINLFNEIINNN